MMLTFTRRSALWIVLGTVAGALLCGPFPAGRLVADEMNLDELVRSAEKIERSKAASSPGAEALVVAWKRAYDVDSTDPRARNGFSRALTLRAVERLSAQNPIQARADASTAAELDPLSAQARFVLAVCGYRTEDPVLARGEAAATLDIEKEHGGALALLGRLAYEDGEIDRAEQLLERAGRAEPSRKEVKALLAKIERERALQRELTDLIFTTHFRLRFAPGQVEQEFARRVGDHLEAAYNHVGQTIGCYPRNVVPVLLYREAAFKEATGTKGWVGALFDGKIRIPITVGLIGDDALLRRTAFHEYTHACIRSQTAVCPTWLHEGLAQHMEGKRPRRRALAVIAGRGGLPRMAALTRGFTGVEKREVVELLYEQSLSFTTFLLDLRGPAEMTAILSELGNGRNIDRALDASFGEDLETLERRWLAGLTDG
jgi:tetratricopeptide (TPR) repeat protein